MVLPLQFGGDDADKQKDAHSYFQSRPDAEAQFERRLPYAKHILLIPLADSVLIRLAAILPQCSSLNAARNIFLRLAWFTLNSPSLPPNAIWGHRKATPGTFDCPSYMHRANRYLLFMLPDRRRRN